MPPRLRLVSGTLLSATALAAIILLAVALSPPGPKPVRIRRPQPSPPEVPFVAGTAVHDIAVAPASAEMNHLTQDAQDAAKILLSYLPTNADQITGQQ